MFFVCVVFVLLEFVSSANNAILKETIDFASSEKVRDIYSKSPGFVPGDILDDIEEMGVLSESSEESAIDIFFPKSKEDSTFPLGNIVTPFQSRSRKAKSPSSESMEKRTETKAKSSKRNVSRKSSILLPDWLRNINGTNGTFPWEDPRQGLSQELPMPLIPDDFFDNWGYSRFKKKKTSSSSESTDDLERSEVKITYF